MSESLRNNLELQLKEAVKERDNKGENHKDYFALSYYIKSIKRDISKLVG